MDLLALCCYDLPASGIRANWGLSVDLENFVAAGRFGDSVAVVPDDSPLLLRDAGTRDVYALDWEEP